MGTKIVCTFLIVFVLLSCNTAKIPLPPKQSSSEFHADSFYLTPNMQDNDIPKVIPTFDYYSWSIENFQVLDVGFHERYTWFRNSSSEIYNSINYLFFIDDQRVLYISLDDKRDKNFGIIYLDSIQFKPEGNPKLRSYLLGYYHLTDDQIEIELCRNKNLSNRIYLKGNLDKNRDQLTIDSISLNMRQIFKNDKFSPVYISTLDALNPMTQPIFHRSTKHQFEFRLLLENSKKSNYYWLIDSIKTYPQESKRTYAVHKQKKGNSKILSTQTIDEFLIHPFTW